MKEVARRHPRDVVEASSFEGVGGFESIDDRSILGSVFPELRIFHQVRRQSDLAVPGQYVLGTTPMPRVLNRGEKIPPLQVVFLKGHAVRVLQQGDKQKKTSVCASSDGKMPLAHLANPWGGNCVDCKYAQWKDGPDNKRIPPPCRQGLAFFGVIPADPESDAAEDTPFWFVCRGVGSFLRAKEFVQASRTARGAKHVCQIVVELTTTEEENNGVIWYEPVFSITDARIPAERYGEMARIAQTQAIYEPFVRDQSVPADDPDVIEVPAAPTTEKAPWESDL